MNPTCPLHATVFKRFEKEGKFWFSHKNTDGTWCNESKLPKQGATTLQIPTETREPVKEPDWDNIALGKVRHGVAIAFIALVGTVPVDSDMVKVMDSWVEYIMTGKATTESPAQKTGG